jgi:tripeptide aminopeptidase
MKPDKTSTLLAEVFMDLVRIPSPSGNERKVAEYVAQFFKPLGWSTLIDNKGNVVAETSRCAVKPIVFVAHMDTVQKPGEVIKPQFDGKRFMSDGTTILGADNKASVAVLLVLAYELYQAKKNPNIVLMFTTREESGSMGSQFLPLNKIKPQFVCNIDGSSPIGTVDYRSYGQLVFSLTVRGKSAHAAIEPEKGVHAIAVMSKVINALPLGKDASGTFNIGFISGGGATNVVPDRVSARGEIRGYSKIAIREKLQRISTRAAKIAARYGASIDVQTVEYTPPFAGKIKSAPVHRVIRAIGECGLVPVLQSASYTSDASFLSQLGYPTVTVCKGGKNPHSTNESITLQEMEQLLSVLKKIVISYDYE